MCKNGNTEYSNAHFKKKFMLNRSKKNGYFKQNSPPISTALGIMRMENKYYRVQTCVLHMHKMTPNNTLHPNSLTSQSDLLKYYVITDIIIDFSKFYGKAQALYQYLSY